MWRSASGADGLLVTTRLRARSPVGNRSTRRGRVRASAMTLIASVVVTAVAVHPEHHDEDSDASQGTQDGECLEHSLLPTID